MRSTVQGRIGAREHGIRHGKKGAANAILRLNWQTRSQVEVDFLIYGPGGLYAIGVKNSTRVCPDDLRALGSFGEDYPQSQRYLLYRGKDRIKRDDVLCIPCDEFLLALKPKHMPT